MTESKTIESPWQNAKRLRIETFEAAKGVRWITCSACNGSGVYDHNGSPPCGSCGGLGKVRGRLNKVAVEHQGGSRFVVRPAPEPAPVQWRDQLKATEQLRQARRRASQGS